MSGIERGHAQTPPGDRAARVRLAEARYAAGRSPREVLRDCYGVPFPDEFFVAAVADAVTTGLLADLTDQPWSLAAAPPWETPPEGDPTVVTERAITDRDPDLVPLLLLLGVDAPYGFHVICYRLTELAAGRTTVFAIDEDDLSGGEIQRCADSLLAALYDHHAYKLAALERKRASPANRGAGSVDAREVAEARTLLAAVERLRREVAPGTSG